MNTTAEEFHRLLQYVFMSNFQVLKHCPVAIEAPMIFVCWSTRVVEAIPHVPVGVDGSHCSRPLKLV
jgi:hypothetical protein